MSSVHEVQRLDRERRRRRWFIRLSLLLLVLLALLGVGSAIVLRSPPLPLEELRARLKELPQDAGLTELKQLLGEPTETQPQNAAWLVCYHTWNTTDRVIVTASDFGEGVIRFKTMFETRVEGWDAWTLRWGLLKHNLGWK